MEDMANDILGCPWCDGTLLPSFAKTAYTEGSGDNTKDDCEAYHCTSGRACAGFHAVPHDTSLGFSGIDRRALVRRFFDALHRHIRLTGCCERLRGGRRTKRRCVETGPGAREDNAQGDAGKRAAPVHSIRARQSPLFDPTSETPAIDAKGSSSHSSNNKNYSHNKDGATAVTSAHMNSSPCEGEAGAHNTLVFYFLECSVHGSSDFVV